MTPDRILVALGKYLAPLAAAEGGVVALSGTPQSTLALLRAGPQQWRIIVQWLRDDQISRSSAMAMRCLVIVQQAVGLPMTQGQDVQDHRAGDAALLSRLHDVINWVRAVQFQSAQIDSVDTSPKAAYFLLDPESPTRQAAAEFVWNYGMDKVQAVSVPVPELPTKLKLNAGGYLQLNSGEDLNVQGAG